MSFKIGDIYSISSVTLYSRSDCMVMLCTNNVVSSDENNSGEIEAFYLSAFALCCTFLYVHIYTMCLALYTVVSQCVFDRNARGDSNSESTVISGLSLLFSLSLSLFPCGHTHQTWLALFVLSLSLAFNGHWTLMWLCCC